MAGEKLQELLNRLVNRIPDGSIFKQQEVAKEYDGFHINLFGPDLEEYVRDVDFLLNMTSFSSKDRIVDLACGTGFSTKRIHKKHHDRIIAIDSSQFMLDQAEKKFEFAGSIICMLGDAEKLSSIPFLVENVDKVISTNAFEYFSDPSIVLGEIHKVLNPGGEYLFSVSVVSPVEQRIEYHVFRAAEEAIKEELDKKVSFPESLSFREDYHKDMIESLAKENNFKIKMYKEKSMILKPRALQLIHQGVLNDIFYGVSHSYSEHSAINVTLNILSKLNPIYSKDFNAGNEAYVCLEKPND